MTQPDFHLHISTKRRALACVLGLGVTLAFGATNGLTQANLATRQKQRVPTTRTGQAAIDRVRGRLQLAYDELGLSFGAPIFLRVIKNQRRLEIWVQERGGTYARLRGYRICGSAGKVGPRKNQQNDRQSEGFYAVTATDLRPPNVNYLGFAYGWPNAFDQTQGWAGAQSLFQAGCSADPSFGLTDPDMEEVYALIHGALAAGQASVPLHIFPFEMTSLRMLTVGEGSTGAFWQQLAPAWQAFERTKKPPQVRVLGRRYIVLAS